MLGVTVSAYFHTELLLLHKGAEGPGIVSGADQSKKESWPFLKKLSDYRYS